MNVFIRDNNIFIFYTETNMIKKMDKKNAFIVIVWILTMPFDICIGSSKG